MKNVTQFIFVLKDTNMAGGITIIASFFVFMAIHKERSVLEGQKLYSAGTSETHL
jgi:hypothetical protein